MKLTWSRLSTNPIFVRLAGRNRWIPPVLVIILVLSTQSALTAFLSIPYLKSPFHYDPIVRMMLVGWLTVLTTPAVVALIARAIVAQNASSNDYQLLTLTNISPAHRVKGFVTGVLYRMRLFLAVLALTAPWLASGMVVERLGSSTSGYWRCSPWDDTCILRITGISLGSAALEAVLVHLMIWGLIMLAVHAGVMVELKWRRKLSAASLATVCILLCDGAVIYGWTMEEWVPYNVNTVSILLLQAGICAGIFALTFGISRLAQRWA